MVLVLAISALCYGPIKTLTMQPLRTVYCDTAAHALRTRPLDGCSASTLAAASHLAHRRTLLLGFARGLEASGARHEIIAIITICSSMVPRL